MNEQTLTHEEVQTIFMRLRIAYGSAFTAKWQGIPMEAVMRDWALRLGAYSGDAEVLGYGLEHLPPDFPPTAMAFAAVCEKYARERAKQEHTLLMTPEGMEWVWTDCEAKDACGRPMRARKPTLLPTGSGRDKAPIPESVRKRADDYLERKGKLHLIGAEA